MQKGAGKRVCGAVMSTRGVPVSACGFTLPGCSGLFCHKQHVYNRSTTDNWQVSHRKSGLTLVTVSTRERARAIMLAIASLPVDWTMPMSDLSQKHGGVEGINVLVSQAYRGSAFRQPMLTRLTR